MTVIRVLKAVNGGDVGVIELGKELGFPFKTGQSLWILGKLFRQHPDGNFTAQVGVLGEIDLAHAALAYFFPEPCNARWSCQL